MLNVSMINPNDNEQSFSSRRIVSSGGSALNSEDAQKNPSGTGDDMYTLASYDKNLRTRANPFWNLAGALKQAQIVGAVIGLVGGVFTATSGAVFTVSSWF